MTYKQILSAVILLSLAFPVLAVAERNDRASAGICARIENASNQSLDRIGQNQDMVRTRIRENRERRHDRRESNIEEKNTRREKWNTSRLAHFEKLAERVETEEEARAVTAFITTIEKAVSDRRDAIDSVTGSYRVELEELNEVRKIAIDQIIHDYKTAVERALNKAKEDCVNGADPERVKENLTSEISSAKDNLAGARREFNGNKSELENLINSTREQIKTVNERFKATVHSAIADLKTAFGEQ